MKAKKIGDEFIAYNLPVDQGFDIPVIPATQASAYATGKVIGGLLTLENIALENGGTIILQDIQILLKSDVAPNWKVYIFDEPPTASTTGDNTAFALVAADLFKLKGIIQFSALGGLAYDLGSVRAQWVGGLGRVMKCKADSRNLYACCVEEGAGVTLGSVVDGQFSFRGMPA